MAITMAMQAQKSPLPQPRFQCSLANTRRDVEDSMRLRYRVFAQEMGAQVEPVHRGLEQDALDMYCRHLLVRDSFTGKLVASTRILTQDRAIAAGGFYSTHEFNLDAVLDLPGRFMEIGRTCVHPDHRRGAVIATLWSGVAGFIRSGDYDHLIGCASIGLNDGFAPAHAIFRQLRGKYSLPAELQVTPRLAVPHAPASVGFQRLPPLLKAYTSLGARIGGPPCWDPAFRVADLFIHLQVEDLSPRYARHFRCKTRTDQPMAPVH